jgi:hypothetical protein
VVDNQRHNFLLEIVLASMPRYYPGGCIRPGKPSFVAHFIGGGRENFRLPERFFMPLNTWHKNGVALGG